MSGTTHLALPYLEAAQAQKHVTHNEALRALDALVHLAVVSRNVNVPPGSPAEGDRYLVGAAPTGAFAGHAGAVAAWQDGVWRFVTPRVGWRVFVAGEPSLIVRDASSWKPIGDYIASLPTLTELGVGAAPDATNKLVAKLNAALFVARATGEGGSGDLRVNFSKQASGNVLSHLFQTNYSGRAEIGLVGDDALRLRVSADGTLWRDAMVADPAANSVALFTAGQSRLHINAAGQVGVGVASPSHRLAVGANGQTSAAISARGAVNALEWGHADVAGYGSAIGFTANAGRPFIAFNAEQGANPDTFRTRGFVGRVIEGDLSGGVRFGRIANASADNQTPTYDVHLTGAGVLSVASTTASTSTTTGALVVGGGIGVGGGLTLGGMLTIDATGARWASLKTSVVSSSYLDVRKGGTSTIIGYVGTDGGAAFGGGAGDNWGVRAENSLFLSGGGTTNLVTLSATKTTFGQPPVVPSFTVAGAPSASATGAGALIFVSNESGGAVLAFSDGANWRRVTDRVVVS